MRIRLLVAATAALLVGACSDGSGRDEAVVDRRSLFAPADDTLIAADADQRAFAEAVATCMREAGFAYDVHVSSAPRFHGRGDSHSWSMPRDGSDWLDHAHRYGYGYVASQRVLDVDQAARDEWARRHPDPNEARAAALSPSARDAYYTALYGERAADGEVDTDAPWPPADPTAGCHGRAVVRADPLTAASGELLRSLADVEQRVAVDPDVTAAAVAWAACMAERGHRAAGSPPQFRFEVQREVLTVLEEGGTAGEETVTVDVGGETFTVVVPRRDPAALADALRREVQVAVADAECDRASGMGRTEWRVREHLQERFVEEHEPALAELVAGAG